MTRISKYAAAAVFTGALALAAATPSQARWHGGHGHGWHNGASAAIGFGVGALAGAAAANAAYPDYYGYDDGYTGAYAYKPESNYYGSRYDYGRSDRNRRDCTLSPASINYVPCDNQ